METLADGHDITSERKSKSIWNIRPNGTSAKNWSPSSGPTAFTLNG
jgi:hypothetical protein